MGDVLENIRFSYRGSYKLLQSISNLQNIIIDYDKQNIQVYESNIELKYFKEETNPIFIFKIPLSFTVIKSQDTISSYIQRIPRFPPPYTIILMRAGNAAIGYFEKGKNIRHKVIRKYMVRKKHGKAQITHNKGRSVGARIRRTQSKEFFKDINEKLNEWDIYSKSTYIFYSCPVRLWSELFKSKVKTPFDKKDDKLNKIPKDINTPNLKELKKTNYFILSGFLEVYKEDYSHYLNNT
jgi:hypothetical protein